jgi:hypothetical protein
LSFWEAFAGSLVNLRHSYGCETDHSTQVTKPPFSHTLNIDITLVELLQALKKLQKNKVAGLDGMKVEFILDVG